MVNLEECSMVAVLRCLVNRSFGRSEIVLVDCS